MKNILSNLKWYFSPLDTCGHYIILKLYKHDHIGYMTKQKIKTDKNEEQIIFTH